MLATVIIIIKMLKGIGQYKSNMNFEISKSQNKMFFFPLEFLSLS